jgi:hypothetical protein
MRQNYRVVAIVIYCGFSTLIKKLKINVKPSNIDDDRNNQNEKIKQQFMKELCRRDNEANRDMNIVDINMPHNEFSIQAIQKKVLGGYSFDEVVNVLRGYEMEDDPYIELLDPERKEKIRLTNTGRAHCGEFGL